VLVHYIIGSCSVPAGPDCMSQGAHRGHIRAGKKPQAVVQVQPSAILHLAIDVAQPETLVEFKTSHCLHSPAPIPLRMSSTNSATRRSISSLGAW